jgi:hypothetical protein
MGVPHPGWKCRLSRYNPAQTQRDAAHIAVRHEVTDSQSPRTGRAGTLTHRRQPVPRLAPIAFWVSMTACLLIGTLAAVAELIAGTRLDRLAEHWASRH